MSRTVKLRTIASARAGDKGNISNIAVWAYAPERFPAIKAALTPERLKAEFGALFRGEIECFALDALCGLNFVLHDGLEGGVNHSLNLDSHGKSFSFLLLDLDIPLETGAQAGPVTPAAACDGESP